LNAWYTTGDVAWVLSSAALVWCMVPGVGFFYSGLLRRKNAVSMIFLSVACLSIVAFQVYLKNVTNFNCQWFFWGYSLVYSKTATNGFIGNLDNIGFRGVLAQPSEQVPELLFAFLQGVIAAFSPALAIGATAERGRILPFMIFIFLWSTVVYDPIASWTWNKNGWAYKLGVLDFAGGTPIHVSSGAAALSCSLILGRRRGFGTSELNYRATSFSRLALTYSHTTSPMLFSAPYSFGLGGWG
jgi:Amt family ammonium transporter